MSLDSVSDSYESVWRKVKLAARIIEQGKGFVVQVESMLKPFAASMLFEIY